MHHDGWLAAVCDAFPDLSNLKLIIFELLFQTFWEDVHQYINGFVKSLYAEDQRAWTSETTINK